MGAVMQLIVDTLAEDAYGVDEGWMRVVGGRENGHDDGPWKDLPR